RSSRAWPRTSKVSRSCTLRTSRRRSGTPSPSLDGLPSTRSSFAPPNRSAEIDRVVVVGCSGAGKTTLARTLATLLDAPHVELDSIFHQPGWIPLGDEEFRATVTNATG